MSTNTHITCECGRVIEKSYYNVHIKRRLHLNRLTLSKEILNECISRDIGRNTTCDNEIYIGEGVYISKDEDMKVDETV